MHHDALTKISPMLRIAHPSTLQKLDVACSEIADAEAVARIIFSKLPGVDRVIQRHNGDAGMRFRKLWDEVNRHLNTLMGPILMGPISRSRHIGWLMDESEEETGESEGETD